MKVEATIRGMDAEIKKNIADLNSDVFSKVVEREVAAEIERRSVLVAKAFSAAKEILKELAKIKPDVVFETGTGDRKVKTEGFSKEVVKKRDDLEKKVRDIDEALDFASERGDYQKLENLTK